MLDLKVARVTGRRKATPAPLEGLRFWGILNTASFCILSQIGHAGFEDAIAQMDQLAHRGAKCRHLRFSLGQQAFIESFDVRVVLGCDHCGHKQYCPDSGRASF